MVLAGLVMVVGRADAAEPMPCDPVAAVERQVAKRGYEYFRWVVEDLPAGVGGRVDWDDRVVRIDPELPCWVIPSAVNHEWVHVRQYWRHRSGDRVYEVYGDDMEKVTDCASKLLGSTYTPYIEDCTADQLRLAEELIR